jgi:hypothetical protein
MRARVSTGFLAKRPGKHGAHSICGARAHRAGSVGAWRLGFGGGRGFGLGLGLCWDQVNCSNLARAAALCADQRGGDYPTSRDLLDDRDLAGIDARGLDAHSVADLQACLTSTRREVDRREVWSLGRLFGTRRRSSLG